MDNLDLSSLEPRTMTLFVGKVNINPSLFSPEFSVGRQRLRHLFEQPLKQTVTTIWGERESTWVVIDNELVETPIGVLACGRLGRIGQRSVPGFDLDMFKRVRTVVPNAYEHSNFVFDPETELIVFEERASISERMFRQVFAALCQLADPDLGHMSVYPKIDMATFEAAVKRLARVRRMEIDFVRPNPVNMDGLCDEFRRRLLDEPNSDHTAVHMESTGGLRADSAAVAVGLQMVDKTYGSAEFEGDSEAGISVVIRSDDQSLKRSVQALDDPRSFVKEFVKVHIEFGHREHM